MIKLEWIAHPGVQYAVMAVGLCVCLYLFLTLTLDLRAIERRGKLRAATLAEAMAGMRASLDLVEEHLARLEEQTGMLVPPAPLRSGLNLSKRGQALQLHRRGQSPAQIAAALGLPQSEIDLLIKVHRLVLEKAG